MKYLMSLLLVLVGLAQAAPMPVISEGVKPTYHVTLADIIPAATATDVVTLCGSATKTIRVNRIQITADATAASVLDLYVFKRSVADTGGTSAAQTSVSHDSHDAVASAVVKLYSVNPTGLGTGILLVADHYALPAAATTGYPGVPWVEDFGNRNDKTVVLYGTAECLAFSLNGQTIPAGTGVYISFSWTEE
jgi:hypothetical protein